MVSLDQVTNSDITRGGMRHPKSTRHILGMLLTAVDWLARIHVIDEYFKVYNFVEFVREHIL